MMRAAMKRAAVVLVVLLALGLCASVALAANHEPQKKFTPAGQARAKSVAFRQADFPAGWVQQPVPPNKKAESNPRCSFYDPDQSDLVEIGDYDSPDFNRADGSSVSSSSGVFRTVQMAKTGYRRVAVPVLGKCFAEIFKKGVKAPNSVTIFSAGALRFPPVGEQSHAWRISGLVKTPGGRARIAVDVVVFNKGAIDVAVLMLGIGNPLPSSLETALVRKLAARA
jgi:hypothetical protein